MENGQATSVRRLPGGRLHNIRQQFESSTGDSSSRPSTPAKPAGPPPKPAASGGASRSNPAVSPKHQPSQQTMTCTDNISAQLMAPEDESVPPIPPKENMTPNKMQMFNTHTALVRPPGNKVSWENLQTVKKNPNIPGKPVSPKPANTKPVTSEDINSKKPKHAQANDENIQDHAEGDSSELPVYAVVNKPKNGVKSEPKETSRLSTLDTAKLFESNMKDSSQEKGGTPKKEKPAVVAGKPRLMEKPKLCRKPDIGDSREPATQGTKSHENSENTDTGAVTQGTNKKLDISDNHDAGILTQGIKPKSPKRQAPIPKQEVNAATEARRRTLRSSQSLGGELFSPPTVMDESASVNDKGVKGQAPPMPPQKPPRTHAHDKYLDPKAEKLPISPKRNGGTLKSKGDKKLQPKDVSKILQPHINQDVSARKSDSIQRRPDKPKRPPPPRPKSSPSFSSAKGFSYLDGHNPIQQVERSKSKRKSPVFDKQQGTLEKPEMVNNPVYESSSDHITLPVHKPLAVNVTSPLGVHHNALHHKFRIGAISPHPRTPAPSGRGWRAGMFRSCSDECLYMEPTLSDDPVYMDPIVTCRVTSLDDTYASQDVEVYIDSDGYAVPHRFKRRGSPEQRAGPGVKDKFRGLFRLFSDPSQSPAQDPDNPKSQKKRIVAVKQKINHAFALLQKIVKKRESGGETNRDSSDRQSVDSDGFVDITEIMKRVDYVNTVKSKTYASVRKLRQFTEKIYPQLYECAIIVGLQQKQIEGRLTNQPHIVHKFPEIRLPSTPRDPHHIAEGMDIARSRVMVNIAETIPLFCFPDAEHINTGLASMKSESFSFVLTDEDGNHVFGCCRRYRLLEDGTRKVEVICILSPISAYQMYNQLLDELEKRRKVSLDQAQEMIASSFGRPLPNPGKTVQIRTMAQDWEEVESISLSRAYDTRLENVNFESLLSVLGCDKLVKVFASMLLERRLLFSASSLGVLSSTIQALASLLYPFGWHHTFIPVLPPSLLEIVCAPTPYIIGILSSEMPRIEDLPMEEALIIDLDSKCLMRVFGDETTILPKKVHKALKTALNLSRLESDDQSSQNLMMSEAFIRLFVELIGHFGDHIITQQDGKKVFQKEAFISGAKSDGISQFLQWFTDTQMFDVFITDQIEKEHHKTAELFLTRIMEYKDCAVSGPTLRSNVREFGRKFKNLGKVLKTKLT